MTAFPRLERPVSGPEVFVAPATLDARQGHDAVLRSVREGILKPFDIDRADLDAPVLLYAPFYRVAVSVDGFHLGLGTISGNGRTLPVPIGGARHKDGVVMVSARTILPYEPKLPSIFGRLGGTPPLEISTDALRPLADARDALDGGEIVDADVDSAKAVHLASAMLVRAVSPNNAIYAKYEPRVTSVTFVLYPLYFARYRYEGEARRHPGESMFVAVSGRTGKLVASRQPSAVRAVAGKVRRLLSFDRR
jgi:hypothetical protein